MQNVLGVCLMSVRVREEGVLGFLTKARADFRGIITGVGSYLARVLMLEDKGDK